MLFQPFDGRQIEMICRLVEQQHARLRREHARESGATDFAAGELAGVLLAGEAELLEDVSRLVRIIRRIEAIAHIVEGGCVSGELRLLRQVAHRRAGLKEALASVRLDQASRDLQQS